MASKVTTAKFLKQSRVRLGLSQTKLGKRLGFTKRQIMRYETGRARPRPSVRLAVEYLLIQRRSA